MRPTLLSRRRVRGAAPRTARISPGRVAASSSAVGRHSIFVHRPAKSDASTDVASVRAASEVIEFHARMTNYRVFSRIEANLQGFSDRSLHTSLNRGELIKVRRGAYGGPSDHLPAALRHRALISATSRELGDSTVISDWSAAVMHGLLSPRQPIGEGTSDSLKFMFERCWPTYPCPRSCAARTRGRHDQRHRVHISLAHCV